MHRERATYILNREQVEIMKLRMLNWSRQFSILLFLDSNNYPSLHGRYECLLAVGAVSMLHPRENDALKEIQDWHDQHKDWLFGHICYDYKNQLESKLQSLREAHTHFSEISFFQPCIVIYIDKHQMSLTVETLHGNPDAVFKEISATTLTDEIQLPAISFQQRIGEPLYLETIQQLRQHIEDGDCYEINFCNEGYAENVAVDTLAAFKSLNKLSPTPFAAYYKWQDKYLLCASPERYLYKEANTVLSQPIKGTARRGKDLAADELHKKQLQESIKERAENVMIVDLVRNDLARCCETGSVKVDELFGIYTFPQVHQMISTVSGKLKTGVGFTDAIRYTFPMGSMTGAPKIMVMQLIEQYEKARRELFAGTVGYIDPKGDFDFNVIIRSLFYNESTQYLSYQTGGAITYDSDPKQEYEEMRLKAWALERIFAKDAQL